MLESEDAMTFDEWWASKTTKAEPLPWVKDACKAAWDAATVKEREACAKAAEGFTETRDDRRWVPGSLYDTLRRETAAFIRMRSNAEIRGGEAVRVD